MNVRLTHEFRFEAARRLPRLPATHRCAQVHGHSFRVEVTVAGPVDPDTGWLVDFAVLHEAWLPLAGALDHRYLNDVPGLENPTSEHLARWIWQRLAPALPLLERITVWETPVSRCEYTGD